MPDAPPPPRAAAAAGRARRWLRASAPYAGAAAASILVAVLMLRLWTADLRAPFDYGGDAFFFSMITKAIAEGGGWLTNAHLGAPGVLELYDFPLADLLHNLIFKGMVGELKELMKRSRELGMQTFDQALFDLYEAQVITYEDALRNADSVNDLRLQIKLNSQRARVSDLAAGTEHLTIV